MLFFFVKCGKFSQNEMKSIIEIFLKKNSNNQQSILRKGTLSKPVTTHTIFSLRVDKALNTECLLTCQCHVLLCLILFSEAIFSIMIVSYFSCFHSRNSYSYLSD
jgi:hypothetical protein